MTAIPAYARGGDHLAGHRGPFERVVAFAVGEQTGIGGDHRSAKLEHRPTVEIEPEYVAIRFTRRVRFPALRVDTPEELLVWLHNQVAPPSAEETLKIQVEGMGSPEDVKPELAFCIETHRRPITRRTLNDR